MTPHESVALCICGDSECKVAYGTCHCGCGEITKPAGKTDKASGRILGVPVMYKKGHSTRVLPNIEDAAPFKIDGVYCRLIPLTKGQFTIVDEEDFVTLSSFKWCCIKARHGFYAMRGVGYGETREYLYMHREVLRMEASDKRFADHINGTGLDNRRKNLRIATQSQNEMNSRKKQTNKSGFKGVSLGKKRKSAPQKWRATIQVDGKYMSLGEYYSPELAHAAYCEAADKFFGEFAHFG